MILRAYTQPTRLRKIPDNTQKVDKVETPPVSRKAMLQKVLLMGKSGAGKTSMRSIIFANYLARDTMRLGATIDVEHSHVRFLGNLVLNLWDCGGQEAFMENYFESQRDHIFRNVQVGSFMSSVSSYPLIHAIGAQVLIYVFDIESRELAKDMEYYASCLQAVKQNSKSAKVFCLVHKMDLIPDEQREEVFQQRQLELMRLAQPLGLQVACFKTSIWDETLYRAWSQMVYSLIPNRDHLQSHLERLCEVGRSRFGLSGHVITDPTDVCESIAHASGLPSR